MIENLSLKSLYLWLKWSLSPFFEVTCCWKPCSAVIFKGFQEPHDARRWKSLRQLCLIVFLVWHRSILGAAIFVLLFYKRLFSTFQYFLEMLRIYHFIDNQLEKSFSYSETYLYWFSFIIEFEEPNVQIQAVCNAFIEELLLDKKDSLTLSIMESWCTRC